jgi:hypothetical protein
MFQAAFVTSLALGSKLNVNVPGVRVHTDRVVEVRTPPGTIQLLASNSLPLKIISFCSVPRERKFSVDLLLGWSWLPLPLLALTMVGAHSLHIHAQATQRIFGSLTLGAAPCLLCQRRTSHCVMIIFQPAHEVVLCEPGWYMEERARACARNRVHSTGRDTSRGANHRPGMML